VDFKEETYNNGDLRNDGERSTERAEVRPRVRLKRNASNFRMSVDIISLAQK
jgi:hypothetical protein